MDFEKDDILKFKKEYPIELNRAETLYWYS